MFSQRRKCLPISRPIPKYRCFKPKNLGLVVIDGKQLDLGAYGTPEFVAEYNRLIQEWLARDSSPLVRRDQDVADPTINELILAFLAGHAEFHCRDADGTPTGEFANYGDSLQLFRNPYGRTPAVDLSPLKLKAVPKAMIGSGLARGTINQRIGRIMHLFKWSTENEIVPTGRSPRNEGHLRSQERTDGRKGDLARQACGR